jgi:hypothetical protein
MTDTKIPGEFRINLQRNRVLIRPQHGAGKMLEANAGIVAAVQPRARALGATNGRRCGKATSIL